MPREFSRTLRVNELLQREIAQLLPREVKDPRIGMVTITSVEVTRDLSVAKVYFSLLSQDSDIEETLIGLSNASGYLHRLLKKSLHLRHIPELRFIYDSSTSYGMKMADLIEEAIRQDAGSQNPPSK